jgi:hypothetical protein
MEYLRRLALAIALMAMVSLAVPAFASSLTLSATMPQILSVQFPVSNNFGELIPYGTSTVDNQIRINANCNWALAVYAQDDGYGHHGYLTQQHPSSMHDWIKNPVSIYIPTYMIGPTTLEYNYYYNPIPITSGSGGMPIDISYQLSTSSTGTEDSRYPYTITLDFVLTAQ